MNQKRTLDCTRGILLPMLVLCPAVIEERRLDASVACCGVCDLILLDDARTTRSSEGTLMLSQERNQLRLKLTSRGDDNNFFVGTEASYCISACNLSTTSLHLL